MTLLEGTTVRFREYEPWFSPVPPSPARRRPGASARGRIAAACFGVRLAIIALAVSGASASSARPALPHRGHEPGRPSGRRQQDERACGQRGFDPVQGRPDRRRNGPADVFQGERRVHGPHLRQILGDGGGIRAAEPRERPLRAFPAPAGRRAARPPGSSQRSLIHFSSTATSAAPRGRSWVAGQELKDEIGQFLGIGAAPCGGSGIAFWCSSARSVGAGSPLNGGWPVSIA